MAALLAEVAASLTAAGVPEAQVNAERLLMHVLSVDRGGLFLGREQPVDADVARRVRELTARRARRIPLQHVLGETEFYGRSFRCDERALIPRPETEGLIDAVLAALDPRRATVVDLGTGSGCIGWTLALERPAWTLRALDRSSAALALARENAARLGILERVELAQGDFARPPAAWAGCDAVVSNPPYVSDGDWAGLQPEVRDHDPREALTAGADGLAAYRILIPAAVRLLRRGGLLALELGAAQQQAVTLLAEESGFVAVDVSPDLAGIPRVFCARLGEGEAA